LTPRDEAVLLDILKACRLAIEFMADMDRAASLRMPRPRRQ